MARGGATTTATTVVATTGAPTGPLATDAAPGPAATVAAWFAAVASHDVDAAWALVHEASRGRFTGPGGFAEADAARAEGYGLWATSTDLRYTVVPLPAAGEAVPIVVVIGTVPMEGGSERVAGAVPVRTDADGRHQVDPFQDLVGQAGIEHGRVPGATIGRDHTFQVELGAGCTVSLVVDDEVLATSVHDIDGDRQRVSGAPARELTDGEHTLTVVVERDGAVQARSTIYHVAG